jgi:CRP-like cAMP-binding protein
MPFDDTLFIKRNVDILSYFADEKIRQITAQIERQIFRKGQTVVFQGEISHNFCIIKRGRVQAYAKEKSDKLLVGELGPGDFFGELSLLDSTTANATIRASEDDTEILNVPHDTFNLFLRENPALELALREKIAARQKERQAKIQARKAAPPPASAGGIL